MVDFSQVKFNGHDHLHAPEPEKKKSSGVATPIDKSWGGLDKEKIKEALKRQFKKGIEKVKKLAAAVQITDEETNQKALTLTGEVIRLTKAIEIERKKIVGKPKAFTKEIDSFCKIFKDDLKPIETGLRHKIADHQRKVRKEQEEQQRRERIEAARKQREIEEEIAEKNRKLQEEARAANVEAPVPIVAPPSGIVPLEKPETVTRTETGVSSHLKTVWKFKEVHDFSMVSDSFKMLNEKAVNRAIKAGQLNIPGLVIEEVPQTNIRT